MNKHNFPTGLIRYASNQMILMGEKFKFTTRIIAYSLILISLLSFLGFLMVNRSPLEASIVRTPGKLYQEQEDNEISNLYNLKVINKTRDDMPVEIKLTSHDGRLIVAAGDLMVLHQEKTESIVLVYLKKSSIKNEKTKITFGIFSGDELLQEIDTWFIGPKITE